MASAFGIGAVLLLNAQAAMSQTAPPEKARGVSRKDLASINLALEIDGMSGRVLKQHRTTIEPGGAIPLHDHVDRPEIIFIFAGRLIDHQGEDSREYVAGESYTVGKNNRHWLENKSSEPAVFIATSVVRQP
jgi:quercetin dioxygenase-like cupin family protein